MISKRAVFYIGGYDPKSAEQFYFRLDREIGRFQSLWDVETSRVELQSVSDDVTRATYTTEGSGWRTETDFHFLTLDDIVLTDFNKPLLTRFARYVKTSGSYVVSGTMFRFFRHAWRFALYFLYPILTAGLAVLLGYVAHRLLQLTGMFPFSVSLIAAAATTASFFWWMGKSKFIFHLMDLWSFSRNFIDRSRQDIQIKLANFANLASEAIKNNHYDEVLFVGHSTGGALILDTVGRALDSDPELGSRAGHTHVLTIGSTALKIGLHPNASWFRKRVGTIVDAVDVGWIEYQCLTDIINFYKTNPASLMTDGRDSSTVVRRVRMRDMLLKDAYKQIRRNLFRVHYQFVFANTKKYHYDFPAICFGPSALIHRTMNPEHFMSDITPPNVSTK